MIATANSATPALGRHVKVDGLSYTYAGAATRALDGINLEITAGEFACVLGPSGCGKSTLLRLIAGLLRPSEGRLDVGDDGHRPVIGWMAQRDGLLPWRSVLDNTALPLDLLGQSRSAARTRAGDVLDHLGLRSADRLYPHQLSGGMRQRAALARALVHRPNLLLLDEPFAHLDEITRDDLGEELVRLWREQQPTVIMVTHSAIEAVRLADRVIVLSPGPGRLVGEVDVPSTRPHDETDPDVVMALHYARDILKGRTA